METANESCDHERANKEGASLDLHMAYFHKKYRPDNPDDAFRFDQDLFSLVRAIYEQASKPYQKALNDAMRVATSTIPIDKLFPGAK